ncbi:MAG: aminoglycoside phosphotransferase family protein [Eubacteriales bacterium]
MRMTASGIAPATMRALLAVCEAYRLQGDALTAEPVLNGHINETFLVTVSAAGREDGMYVFQNLNRYVFKDPLQIMQNIQRLSDWLDGPSGPARPGAGGGCSLVKFICNKDQQNYTVLEDGSFWRVSEFVRNSVTYETAKDADMLKRAGFAFGNFQQMLAGMPADELKETIPDFHHTRKRTAAFFEAVANDPHGRAAGLTEEIRFFERYRDHFAVLGELQDAGKLPLRITHNDTKCNNILFDRDSGEPLAVIDLDTVMPGLVAHDYGDAIRYAANTAAEDETDLSRVSLSLDYYRAFTEGFMEAVGTSLTEAEITYMALGAPTMTFEVALRFLTDYINGDRYFRIHREGHNLDRARCQIRLCKDMMEKYGQMCEIVSRCV